MKRQKRIGIFGWGLVAPKSRNINDFEANLESTSTWLAPFDGFGPSNFLTGAPEFDLDTYRPWFDARFPPSRFGQFRDKMGPMVQYAVGSFIQALGQNEGMEQYLQSLGDACHVYVGTGLGEITVQHQQSLAFERAKRRWDAFWAAPERCEAHRKHLEGDLDPAAPADPATLETGSEEWFDAKSAWNAHWAGRSEALREYLRQAAEIQSEPVPAGAGTGKLNTIRQKLSKVRALNKQWGCPEEPWASVSPNILWNIANIPAAQISMVGHIMGPAYAPIAACASFGIALRMGLDAIELGHAKAVVVGMTDPPPHPVIISAFYNANVVTADGEVSRPMTGLKGTHVAGGSCVWIIGDAEEMLAQGFRPLGMEVVEVGTSSDAHHIITPSKDGPQIAMRRAMETVDKSDIWTWDMHATATPGDATEVEHSLELLDPSVVFTARKGTFGHGMSVGGGWELTAQHLGMAKGHLFPIDLAPEEVHADVAQHHANFVMKRGCDTKHLAGGKLSMGIGGINSCVISRPWDQSWILEHFKPAEPKKSE
jgi:3-oxoacyl-(acyl-carrier-protein) synthase